MATATNTGQLLVFAVSDMPVMEKGKGEKILNIPGKKVVARAEFVAGTAVFQEGQSLLLRTGKGELKLKAGAEVDAYVGKRTQRGARLPKGHQEVKGIQTIEK
jgi:topoisomerase-4 subunit A